MNIRKTNNSELKKTAVCICAAFVYAVGMNFFIVPSDIYAGGLFGLCQIIRTLLVNTFHLNIQVDIASIIYYILNVPLFICARIRISRGFLLRSVVTLSVMTAFLALLPLRALLPDDRLASCAVGAILCGVSTGFILREGSSAGGFDIIGLLLASRRQDLSVGRVNGTINLALYAACFILFSVDVLLYSILFTAVYSFAVDRTHSQNINVEVKIVTSDPTDKLEQAILHELGRGVTVWNSTGAYSRHRNWIVFVVLSKYELPALYSIVDRVDSNAFITISEPVRVRGHYLKKL